MSNEKKFKKDLKTGIVGEKLIAKYMKEKGYKIINYCINMDYDIMIEDKNGLRITLEVKTDRYELYNGITNNMFLEVKCNGKRSGISGTKADIFVYFYPEHELAYFIRVDEVRKLANYGRRTTMSGDGGLVTGYLINRFDYEHMFKVVKIERHHIWDKVYQAESEQNRKK